MIPRRLFISPLVCPSPQDGSDSVDSGDNGYYVEAGTKTTVGVTATGFDERPGSDSGDVGCGEDGCLPELAHDGVGFENGDDVESRWSCAENIVLPGKKQCEIEFTFDAPQHIADVQVAFWKGDERARTLKVCVCVLRRLRLARVRCFCEPPSASRRAVRKTKLRGTGYR